MNLKDFQNTTAETCFGKEVKTDKEKGLCIQCHEPALENCYSDAGKKEYFISGLCEKCFDNIFK